MNVHMNKYNLTNIEADNVLNRDWIFLVGRPYTLFGASLYQAWFDSPQIYHLFGCSIPDNLYMEEHPNIVRRYVLREQLENFSNAIRAIVIKDKLKSKRILEKGVELNEKAKQYLLDSPFDNLESAVNFLIELALHATVFSYFSYPVAKEIGDQELIKISERLRAISYYPEIVAKIINPLAQLKAGDSYNLMTINELLNNKSTEIKLRLKESKNNKRFVYAKLDGKEIIWYTDNIIGIIEKLEKTEINKSVSGQPGYPGKVTGKVKLILSNDINIKFNKGDILITPTSNPTLMPLIIKAGAIVTDEGGVTSHAAIISRELKKPSVIGTKYATHVFKDGDMVEVDANSGLVKKLK